MSCVGLLLARKGSKGWPGKNRKPFRGKPLFRYGLDVALDSPTITTVFVSTDDEVILDESEKAGAVPLPRPEALSGDDVPMIDVILYERERIRSTVPDLTTMVVFLANSPTIDSALVERCLAMLDENPEADSVIPVAELPQWTPLRAMTMVDGTLRPWVEGSGARAHTTNRQEAPKTYFATNSCFAIRASSLDRADRSPFNLPWLGTNPVGCVDEHAGLDVDTPDDLWQVVSWWNGADKLGLDPATVLPPVTP